MKILFVCTGNTCRSVMAEAILKDLLEKEGRSADFEVSSAGLFAQDGEPPTFETQVVIEKAGIDLKEEGATYVDDDVLESADLILTMTEGHKIMIEDRKDEGYYDGKLYTLKEYTEECKKTLTDSKEDSTTKADTESKAKSKNEQQLEEDAYDISDPYGKTMEVYGDTFREIYGEVEILLQKLLEKC